MRRPVGTISAAALVAAFGLLLAGCGGSSKPASSTSAGTTTASSSSTGTSTSATSAGGAGKLKILTAANCHQLLNLTQSFAQAMAGDTKGLAKTAALVQTFANEAPAAISPDFQVLADEWQKVEAALKGADLSSGKAPSAAVLERLVKLSSQIDAQKLTTSTQAIVAWANANCGKKTG
jgi:hypothetical protein